jgi:carbohydrate kinase (thermoresistant glucokinase family)
LIEEYPFVPPLVVMGVSGSGKSTIGALLGDILHMPFIDGDDLHTPASKVKMASGMPLEDDDRWPWLDAIGRRLTLAPAPIIACSALKRSYRNRLRLIEPDALFVHLDSPVAVIVTRVRLRKHEYMPASLLESQFSSLEPLLPDERGIVVNTGASPKVLAEEITRLLLAH